MHNKAMMILVLYVVSTVHAVLLLNTHVLHTQQVLPKDLGSSASTAAGLQEFYCAHKVPALTGRKQLTTENKDVYNNFLSSSAHHYLGAELCSNALFKKKSAV